MLICHKSIDVDSFVPLSVNGTRSCLLQISVSLQTKYPTSFPTLSKMKVSTETIALSISLLETSLLDQTHPSRKCYKQEIHACGGIFHDNATLLILFKTSTPFMHIIVQL